MTFLGIEFHPFRRTKTMLGAALIALFCGFAATLFAEDAPIAQYPLYGGAGVNAPPLTMLVMGRDHTLYYEAYNDASDLSGNGVLDVGYKPNMTDPGGEPVDYFGYFDSHLCYSYSNNRFTPTGAASNKKCSGSWSGDFLNYITTARIDALRKVLYGGHRVVDTETETVIERSYIPQDAHSWGKEYRSIEHDGYDIRHYTPLALPAAGARHLFANTTLLKDDVMAPNRTADMAPLMRVLTNSRFRIWEWVAIERHVSGSRCLDGRNNNNPCVYAATTLRHSHPLNAAEFQSLIAEWGTETQKCGSGPIPGGNINTTGSNNNPFALAPHCRHDYYLTRIQGQIYAPVAGDYLFATNGDDAVELRIDGEVVSYWYGGHGPKTGTPDQIATAINNETRGHNGTKNLAAGWHDFEFRHEERTGGDNFQLLWRRPGQSWQIVPASDLRGPVGDANTAPIITTYSTERSVPASDMTDYVVRVKVCDPAYPDANCKTYPSGSQKPVGLLQQYGETDRMLFGLLSGSFNHPHNMRGGLLRKNIESFRDEIDSQTGQFTDLIGIARTIDRFRIVDFDASTNFEYRGGWLNDRSMGDSTRQFPDWGNPIAEMMYESLRYFSGKENPTSQFMPTLSNGMESITVRHGDDMELPAPTWKDPYTRDDNPALYCSPGAQLVISDVNPSFDTEFVPGSAFSGFSGDITGLNAANESQAIWNHEHGGSSLHFIGELAGNPDGTPSPKTVSSLGNIRGLAPAEPTKRGGYYSAAIARYGFEQDLRDDLQDKQNIHTFAVALASPLPKIEIPVAGQVVTVVPFAKSVGQGATDWTGRNFQPTSTIVDFFVDTFANTDPQGSDADPSVNDGRALVRFRINYEDVEQGADHDMDAIVLYELKVNEDNELTVNLTSEYAAGHTIIHMGYVISGTSADGVYLEVRDLDSTSVANPVNFAFDTPPGVSAGGCAVANPPAACSEPLPFFATRTFTASNTPAATLLENPLWYAAKYGSGPTERVKGEASENYFLVTNAGKLQAQLERAFDRIMELGESSVATVAASSAGRVREGTRYFKASFDAQSGWAGDIEARELDDDEDQTNDPLIWTASSVLPGHDKRKIFTSNGGTAGEPFTFDKLTSEQKAALGETETVQREVLNYLRGDQDNEQSDPKKAAQPGEYRKREKLIGDIVNSNPIFVGKPANLGYGVRTVGTPMHHTALPPGTAGSTTYSGGSSTYIEQHKDRTPMIYVGANDGMLHAFHADTGVELFAYVPRTLFPKLKNLTEPSYNNLLPNQHQFYVDGTPQENQAFFDSAWRSVLLGSLGAGGRGVFALDVTDDPLQFDESKVLWEINSNDSDFLELGHLINQFPMDQPSVGRLYSGDWAAVFGNGFDSKANEDFQALSCDAPSDIDRPKCESMGAYLFIVDIKTGTLIKKIRAPAPQGASQDARNGLAAVGLVQDRNAHIVGVYAGDLLGNLWKFDLADKNPENWKVAYDGMPLFRATDPDGNPQPITAQAHGGYLDAGGGYIVNIGTGQFMREGDEKAPVDPDKYQVQTLYGIWDAFSLDYPDPTDLYPNGVGEPPTWKIDEDGIKRMVQAQQGGRVNGIVFANLESPVGHRSQLEQQDIKAELDPSGSGEFWWVISHHDFVLGPEPPPPSDPDAPPPTPQKRGWLIDIVPPDAPDGGRGDRIINFSQNLVGSGNLTFNALRPLPNEDNDPCKTGSTKTVTCVVNIITGGGAKIPIFDINNDGQFDNQDLVSVNGENVPPTCRESKLSGAPRILLPELPKFDEERDDVDRAGSWVKEGTLPDYDEQQLKADPPAYTLILSDGSKLRIRAPIPGRQGWRQLR